jgi:WD40 repeat protein
LRVDGPGRAGACRLSVDYGAANTVGVVEWPGGHRQPLLFDGVPWLPSGVFAEGNGRLLAGWPAARAARLGPARFQPTPAQYADQHATTLGDRAYPPAELIAATLAAVAAEARRVTGPTTLGQVVLTHPAGWSAAGRGALATAAAAAGLPAPVLLAAPPNPAPPNPAPPGAAPPGAAPPGAAPPGAAPPNPAPPNPAPPGAVPPGAAPAAPPNLAPPGAAPPGAAPPGAAPPGAVPPGAAPADQPESTAAYGALDAVPPPPGRPRRRGVLIGVAATTVALLVIVSGVAATVAFRPGGAPDASARQEPTQRLLYHQVCDKLDLSPLTASLGTTSRGSRTGQQDKNGFSCWLGAKKQDDWKQQNDDWNYLSVRVSYFDTPAKARAAVKDAYRRLGRAKGVSQLRHVHAGDRAYAFTCLDKPLSPGCDAANRATAVTFPLSILNDDTDTSVVFPVGDLNNYAFVSLATGNVMVSAAAQGGTDQWDTTAGRQALDADRTFVRKNLRLLYTTSTVKPTFLGGRTDSVFSLAFSPDGRTIASSDDKGTIRLLNTDTGRTTATFTNGTNGANAVFSLAFSPDGRTLASGDDNLAGGVIRLWDVATGRITKTFHSNFFAVASLAFSPDGRTLATSGDAMHGGAIRLWDVNTGRNIATLSNQDTGSVAFSPDGRTLATGGGGGVQLWNVATQQLITTLTPGNDWGFTVAFSPDGKTVAAGSYHYHNVQLWNVATHRRTATLTDGTGHGNFNSVAFSPDGRTIVGNGDHGIDVWDTATGRLTTTYDGDEPVAFSPDGKTLASGLNGGYVLLWKR